MRWFKCGFQVCLGATVLLLCASCLGISRRIVVTQNEPDDLPPFMGNLTLTQDQEGEHNLCFAVSQARLAENGVRAEQLSRQLHATANVQVNGVRLPEWQHGSLEVLTLEAQLTKDGEVIKSWGGPITFCYLVDQLPPGQHTATFSIEDVSGNRYAYSWQFELRYVFRIRR